MTHNNVENVAATDQHVSFCQACSHPYLTVVCVEIDCLKSENRLPQPQLTHHILLRLQATTTINVFIYNLTINVYSCPAVVLCVYTPCSKKWYTKLTLIT